MRGGEEERVSVREGRRGEGERGIKGRRDNLREGEKQKGVREGV